MPLRKALFLAPRLAAFFVPFFAGRLAAVRLRTAFFFPAFLLPAFLPTFFLRVAIVISRVGPHWSVKSALRAWPVPQLSSRRLEARFLGKRADLIITPWGG